MIDYFLENFKILFLIMVRVTTLFMFIPVLNSREIPFLLKSGLSLFIAIIALPFVRDTGFTLNDTTAISYFLAVLNEFLIGVTIGIIVYMFITVFILSGEYYSMQIGFGIIHTFDPMSQTSIPILGQFQSIIGYLVFILLRAHYYLIIAIIASYKYFPYYTFKKYNFAVQSIVKYFVDVFYIALIFAIPIIGVLLVATIIIGLLAKVAPQINLLVIGFPINIFLGIITLIFLEPILFTLSQEIIKMILTEIHNFMYNIRIY
ncbi:MAG TPA: flagellar biosynthetic protein FliR [bacterium]|nr:flagellar biosynthetic protein FliR [bacterium]HPQ18243.1 flagellar biosynthetic protein FliR [bacterium]